MTWFKKFHDSVDPYFSKWNNLGWKVFGVFLAIGFGLVVIPQIVLFGHGKRHGTHSMAHTHHHFHHH